MPKRQQYEADDGFVEDVPQGKKRKSVGNEMKQQAGKATVSTEMQNDDDGNEYWEVGTVCPKPIRTMLICTW